MDAAIHGFISQGLVDTLTHFGVAWLSERSCRMFCHQAGDSTALVAAFGTHADDPTGSRDDTVFGGHVDERYGRDLR